MRRRRVDGVDLLRRRARVSGDGRRHVLLRGEENEKQEERKERNKHALACLTLLFQVRTSFIDAYLACERVLAFWGGFECILLCVALQRSTWQMFVDVRESPRFQRQALADPGVWNGYVRPGFQDLILVYSRIE